MPFHITALPGGASWAQARSPPSPESLADIKCSPPHQPTRLNNCDSLRGCRRGDYHMPEMNGHEAAIEIKRSEPQIPIVLFSRGAIPKPALNVVDAFVSKSEGSDCLLPVNDSNLR
jgi:DNA-binding NarL/FixJ family response regulator